MKKTNHTIRIVTTKKATAEQVDTLVDAITIMLRQLRITAVIFVDEPKVKDVKGQKVRKAG